VINTKERVRIPGTKVSIAKQAAFDVGRGAQLWQQANIGRSSPHSGFATRPGELVCACPFPATSLRRDSGALSTTVSQPDATSAWKHEVSLRIAAHQSRRGWSAAKPAAPTPDWSAASSRAAQAAARVAARYAQAPSYRQMQEAEAHAALESSKAAAAALAAAEIQETGAAEPLVVSVPVAEEVQQPQKLEALKAVESAQPAAREWEPAVAMPHPAAPSSLDEWEIECALRHREADLRLLPPSPIPASAPKVAEVPGIQGEMGSNRSTGAKALIDHAAYSARLKSCPDASGDLERSFFGASLTPSAEGAPRRAEAPAQSLAVARPSEERWEWQAVSREPWGSEEIEPVEPDLPIHANLIEFPRELVATRKMRPRLAEGPYAVQRTEMQLSIFEVDPGAISTDPDPVCAEPVAAWSEPDWSDIKLEPQLREEAEPEEMPATQPVVQLAPVGRRLMAALVDGVLIGVLLAGPAVMAAHRMGHPSAKVLMLGAVVAFLLGGLLYEALFLILAGATPGMRCACVSLCTFDGQIPTRAQLKSRLGALLLSLVPMGLGAAWALFDDDRLCWHDRLSRTYPRMY